MSSSLRPADPAQRLLSIDALRGLALCGILLINIVDMGGPIAMDRPMAEPSLASPDWQLWGFSQLFITGTMRGLFSMLFGVGLLLFLGDDDRADRPRLYLRRLILLLLFGIVDSTFLLWPGDILLIYALAGIVAMILHMLTPAQLVSAAAVILLLLSAWAGLEAPSFQPADTVYSAEMLAREGAARLGGYWQTFDYMSYVSWNWTVNALTYRWIGDALAFMLVGMALYRIGLFDGRFEERRLRRMVRIGYSVGLALRLLHAVLVFHNDGAPMVVSGIVDQPGRLAMTIGHAGLFLLLWRKRAWPRLMSGLARMGRMALTLYLGQSLIAAWIFSGFGLGLWNRLSWPALWLVAFAILAVQALFAAFWFRAFRYGPMEWLWRWGTYGQRP
ncbi:DUF418 domain-containing protein [Sphingomonas histidinilytica]|uniref:DUF418 domain-containing protein n=1 Tax=Rhizorhabdus histidinilytica TaxID=439228 RepID=A0A1T4ZV48_9SPHN|nr:DUF418 domain-containing protein [Rhizorhabdus histidinilytica]MBO9377530.1 DUF418 domain-containing protein [Rhizorhabdus histidinilytica]SKB26654.1 uncharacterized protein SAMN06295920_101277 [Rhizorhabdus histidinilytica]